MPCGYRHHREALTARYERRHKHWQVVSNTAGLYGRLDGLDAAEGARADVISNVISVDGLYRLNDGGAWAARTPS